MTNKEKIWLVSSPAYKANGNHGVYHSVALCDNDGTIKKMIGDHTSLLKRYKNIREIEGLPFSDSDRFIHIREIQLSTEFSTLCLMEEQRSIYYHSYNEWFKKEQNFCQGDKYKFLFDYKKVGTKKYEQCQENARAYKEWLASNPAPKAPFGDYFFLNFIV